MDGTLEAGTGYVQRMRLTIQVADKIRPAVDRYQAAFPALLEIPSKEHPYGTPHFSCPAVVTAKTAYLRDSTHNRPSCRKHDQSTVLISS